MATTPPASANEKKSKRFRAKTPIDYNNKRYEIGKTLDLDEETAEPLLARGAIEPVAKDKEEPAA